ncbi:MAG: hypothetical protein LBT19_01170 [Candidatus Nomurabacteria bacterium]|nr:hypothetical protein [Candidatus Nomurabacteria bacterium]
MNPDDQNNAIGNPGMPADLGATPAPEPTNFDGTSLAVPISEPVVPARDAVVTPEPAEPIVPVNDTLGNVASEPVSEPEPVADFDDSVTPADTTFTPVTAGQEIPVAEPTVPETTSAESIASVQDLGATNPAAAPAPGAQPAQAKKISTSMIILIAVAAVAIIGVIIALIVSSA